MEALKRLTRKKVKRASKENLSRCEPVSLNELKYSCLAIQ